MIVMTVAQQRASRVADRSQKLEVVKQRLWREAEVDSTFRTSIHVGDSTCIDRPNSLMIARLGGWSPKRQPSAGFRRCRFLDLERRQSGSCR